MIITIDSNNLITSCYFLIEEYGRCNILKNNPYCTVARKNKICPFIKDNEVVIKLKR